MKDRRRPVGLARPYLRTFLLPFLAALACRAVESVCDLLQPTIMARMIDTGVAARDIGVVLELGLRMLAVAALGAAGATGRNVIASIVSFRFGAKLRADLFHRVTSFSFEELDAFDTSSLTTRQTNDVSQVQTFVNGMMRSFAKVPILAVGSLVLAIILEPGLAPVLAVVVPIAAGLIVLNLATGFPRFRRVQKGLDGVNAVTREYLGGIRVVKAFGQEAREAERFAAANGELTAASTTALRAIALFGPAIGLAVNLGIVAVLWIGGFRAAGSSLQVGKIIAFINYMTQLLFSLTRISGIFTSFVRARASWERIGEVLGSPASEPFEEGGPQAPGSRPATPVPRPGGTSVTFRGVSFSYTGDLDRLALERIDLECAPGQITAIIGPTGSGKSTLAALVPRFYLPTRGAVLVDGVEAGALDLRELRQRIALVPQKTVLFTGTIEENLRWGREDARQEELEEAARMARAHDFVSGFPEGYRSRVGWGGVNLSGGQKQRVAIARALVRKPEVLILDDCTSSVDSLTEAEILGSIRGASGFTCILITQRISAAAAADAILVLDEGRPVGLGRHESLVRECELYRDICLAQLGREPLGG